MQGDVQGSTRVASPQIFDRESLDRLSVDGARIAGISRNGGQSVARVVEAPARQSLLGRTFSRFVSVVRGELRIGRKLYHIYLQQFRNPATKTVTTIPEGPLPSYIYRMSRQKDLNTPLGFRVAVAMELAGVCKLNHGRWGGIKIKASRRDIDEVTLRRVDYFVNLNPHRLAFEFLALNRSVPNGYLERVLVPHYCDQLVKQVGMAADAASDAVKVLLEVKCLKGDKDVDLEHLMEMRNALEQMAAEHQRRVQKVVPTKHIPKGPRITGGITCTVSVTADHVLEHGTASRQVVREYFIRELRRLGIPRNQARERVVAVLEQKGMNGCGTQLPLSCFLEVARALELNKHHKVGEVVKAYLGLVDQLHAAQVDMPREQRVQMLEHAGVCPEDTYVTGQDCEGVVRVIECPELEKPKETLTYTCNEDELWLIQTRVDRSFRIRITKDLLKRIQRYAACNKRKILVDTVTRILTAVVLGTVSGGIMGAVYLGTSTVSSLCMTGVDFASGLFNFWKGGRSVIKYDENCETCELEDEDLRKSLYEGLCTLTGEKGLTDAFNAYANLQDDMKGLEELKGKANVSAAGQIRFRRHQVLQQLRTAQLGEALMNMDRLVVQTVTDISKYEAEFEEAFDQLWEPFAHDEENGGISSEHRLKVFRKAIRNMKDLPVSAKEDHRNWLKELSLGGDNVKDSVDSSLNWRRHSDMVLNEAFGKLKPLPPEELRVSALMAKLNWTRNNMLAAAGHTVIVIAHFLWTNLTWNLGKVGSSAFRWFVKDVAPRKADLTPVPTATIVVYWIASFFGNKISEVCNNRLNRLRMKKVVESRKNEEGEDLAFDAEVTKLTTEDWRAMRRESQLNMQKFSKTLIALRGEHLRILEEIKKCQQSAGEDAGQSPKMRMSDDELVQRATLILRRKYLEQEIQGLLSGSVGRFFQEAIRGELTQRQLLEDVETGFVTA